MVDSLVRRMDLLPLFRWAEVVGVGPLQIKYDGDELAIAGTPDTLVSGLAAGDRVFCVRLFRRDIVLGRAKGQANKILWDGVPIYMHGTQVATLSERVSDQATGIVLVWQSYVGGSVKDYDIVYVFVPKWQVTGGLNGKGVQSTLWPRNSATAPYQKYVYVVDDRILGNAINGVAPRTGHVLTAVLGV